MVLSSLCVVTRLPWRYAIRHCAVPPHLLSALPARCSLLVLYRPVGIQASARCAPNDRVGGDRPAKAPRRSPAMLPERLEATWCRARAPDPAAAARVAVGGAGREGGGTAPIRRPGTRTPWRGEATASAPEAGTWRMPRTPSRPGGRGAGVGAAGSVPPRRSLPSVPRRSTIAGTGTGCCVAPSRRSSLRNPMHRRAYPEAAADASPVVRAIRSPNSRPLGLPLCAERHAPLSQDLAERCAPPAGPHLPLYYSASAVHGYAVIADGTPVGGMPPRGSAILPRGRCYAPISLGRGMPAYAMRTSGLHWL